MKRPSAWQLLSSLICVVSLSLLSLSLLTFVGCGSAESKPRFIILSNGNSPFWDAMRAGMNQAGDDLKVNVVMEYCNGKLPDQVDKLRQFGNQTDILGIGVSVLDAQNVTLADELKKLQAQGIKIVTIDSDLDREKYGDVRHAFVGTNNLLAGEELGKATAGLRPDGGNFVAFVGVSGAQNAVERIKGFTEGAGEKFTKVDVKTDEQDRNRAKENVRNAINNPEVDTLVGIWSYNAPAIADIVEELKIKDKYTVAVFDAEPNAIQHMEKGFIDVMLVQNPYEMGYQGIRMLKALVDDDQATLKEMLPEHGQPMGDVYDTGLKIVVPNAESPIKADLFGEKTEFLTLEDFQQWLKKYNLSGS